MNKLFIILFFGTFFFIQPALAESYDIYVDENYDEDDSDGTSEKPYKEISKAIEESGSKGKKIYIKNGKYTENIILEKGIELYGQDKNKTIIEGSGIHSTITAKDKNLIKNLTVQKGSNVISAEGQIKISNCIIQFASSVGINLTEGSGALTLENSKITKNRKGLYIQKGRSVSIYKNEITGNSEEGIDMREKTKGTINGNYIAENGEGGIEIVVGSSDVFIKDNSIKKNSASGIAAQFYSQASKTGKIEIKGNTISSNKDYGITCKAPSGGNYSKDYWNKSIEITENKIDNNKRKSISGSCKLIEAVTEEEEKQNQATESAEAKINPEKELTAKEKELKIKEEEEMKKIEEERIKKEIPVENKISALAVEQDNIISELLSYKSDLMQTKKIQLFFLGPNLKKIEALSQDIQKLESNKKQLEEINKEWENLENWDKVQDTNKKIKLLEIKIEEYRSFLQEQNNQKGLFGWAFKIWNKYY